MNDTVDALGACQNKGISLKEYVFAPKKPPVIEF
jgi:hypothetical protein